MSSNTRHSMLMRPYKNFANFYGDELPVIYVNRATGSDSNAGTFASPKLTLEGAKAIIPTKGARVVISGTTESNFLQSTTVDFNSGTVILEGLNNQSWYCQRPTTINTGGWTSSGGGIYHRSSSAGGALWYANLLDANGLYTILTQNTGTPSTPSAGEFGYVVNELYVHLPGDVDANNYIFKRANTNFLFQVSGTCRLTVNNMIGYYSNNAIVLLSGANARLTLNNCILRYGNGNGVSDSAAGIVICRNCLSQKNTNDGYNQNNATWYVYNCDGSYNLDEGISCHSTSKLNIFNSHFHHNNHGGCTAVGSSVMNINNTIVENNGLTPQAGIEANGINYTGTTSGSIIDTISRNNDRSGFYCDSSGIVTFSNFTSGIAQGNVQADDLC